MPVVPRLNGPQVQERGLSQGRVQTNFSDSAFGIGDEVGKKAIGLLGQVADVVKKSEDDAIQLQVLDAERKRTIAEEELLRAPESGALNQKGQNAFKVPEQTMQAYQENLKKIEEEMPSERARIAFRKLSESSYGQISKTLNNHVNQERETYTKQVVASFMEAKTNEAVANYQDTARLGMALSDQENAIRLRAENQGLPKEVADLEVMKAQSTTHQAVITRMIDDGNELGAQKYFESIKGNMTPDVVAKVNNTLEAGLLLGNSQRMADDFVARSGSMAGALSQARKIEDPKLREATTTKVKEFFALKDAAERQDSETYQRGILDQIDKDPSMDLPPSMLAGLSYGDRNQMLNYLSAKRSGKNIETDRTTYYDLKNLAINPKTKEAFLSMNLNSPEMKMKLSETDWKSFVTTQADLRAGKGEAAKTIDGWRSESDVVSTALGKINLDRKKNPEQYDLLASKIDSAVIAQQEVLGRKLNNDEFKKVVDTQIIEGRVNRPGFFAKVAGQTPVIGRQLQELLSGETVRAYELTPEEVSEFIPSVPKSDRQRIEAAIKKQGKAVSEEAIVRYYIKANYGK